MKYAFINPLPNGFAVRVMTSAFGKAGDKITNFHSYDDAVKFATIKMGKTGCVVDHTKVRMPANVPEMRYAPSTRNPDVR